MITIEIKNLDKIMAAFRRAPALTIREMDEAIKKSVLLLEATAKQTTLFKNVTGHLRATQESRFPMSLEGRLKATRDYAVFVHEGTRFMSPRPWLKEAARTKEASIQNFFSQALKNIINSL